MSGFLILGESLRLRRRYWWRETSRSPERWTLCLPTAGQVQLAERDHADAVTGFETVATLESVARALAVALGLVETPLDDTSLLQLAERTVKDSREARRLTGQIQAWQHAGWQSAFVAGSELGAARERATDDLAAFEAIEAVVERESSLPMLATGPWCLAAVARALSTGTAGDIALPRLYLDAFHGLSPVAVAFVNALVRVSQVRWRTRAVSESAAAWALARTTVEGLAAQAELWTLHDDNAAADVKARESVAAKLFPDEHTSDLFENVPIPVELSWKTFASIDAELAAIGATIEEHGLGEVVVAVPDAPAYRDDAAASLAGKTVEIVTHGELALATAPHVFFAGADGNAVAERVGGWPSADALRPALLLDAVEAAGTKVWASDVKGPACVVRAAVLRVAG